MHFTFRLPRGWVLCLPMLLGACTTTGPLRITEAIQSPSHGSRVRYIVLHYTASPTKIALEHLTGPRVSAHYLISDDSPPVIYRMVSEERRAWHAGAGSWFGNTDINTGSIGIEIVNAGLSGPDQWAPYTKSQITKTKDLVRDIAQRHQVIPENIIGHSDMAPQRKIDPGPLFPWEQLALAGLGRWYDEQKALQLQAYYLAHALPSARETQALLRKAGYDTPDSGIYDKATRNVLAAFQMHYRPTRYDGILDAETLSILLSLQ